MANARALSTNPAANQTATSLAVLHQFWELAKTAPDVVAVVDKEGQRRTTYREFVQLTNNIAVYLKDQGVGVGSLVALHMPKTREHYAARIACAFVGAGFLSLDPAYPEQRTKTILADCAPLLTLSQEMLEPFMAGEHPCQINDEVSADSLGYVAYTSGTTGAPKGIRHDRTYLCLYACMFNYFDASIAKTFLKFVKRLNHVNHAAVASSMFAISIPDMACLFFGHTVHLIDSDLLRDIVRLRSYFIDQRIFSVIATPSFVKVLGPTPHLRFVCLGGEPVRGNFSEFKHTFVMDTYGCSEAPLISLLPLRKGGKLISFGSISLSETDEILYQGPGVMLGYIGGPADETSLSVDSKTGQRVLHTHDRGRITEHGISVVGRLDDVYKISGNRVSISEVEAVLASCKGVEEAGVVAVETGHGTRLYGFYSASEGMRRSVQDVADGAATNDNHLVAELKEKLAPYMVPSSLEKLVALPRNISGKIDHDALRKHVRAHEHTGTLEALHTAESKASNTDAPKAALPNNLFQTQLQAEELQVVLRAMSEVLGTTCSDPNAHFASLGGDSLDAMKLQVALKSEFGVLFSANELLELGSAAGIVEALKAHNALEVPEFEASRDLLEEDWRFTESQLNVYLGAQTRESNTAYSIPFFVKLPASVTKQQLQDAFDYLCKKHPILRAQLVQDSQGGHFVLGPAPELVFGTRSDALGFVRPFGFNECFVRTLAIPFADGFELYLDINHLIADGASINLLAKEIGSYLFDPSFPAEPDPEPDLGFLRQAAFEDYVHTTPAFEAAHSVFNEMLAEAEDVAELLPNPGTGTNWCRYRLDVDRAELEEFCRSASVTLNQLFVAAFAYTLSRFTGDERALFCIITDGRGDFDLSGSVGMFTKTLPLLINCKNQDTVAFLSAAAKRINAVMRSGIYPFRLLAGEYAVTSSIQFQYSHELARPRALERYGIAAQPLAHDTVADLEVNVFLLHDGGFACDIRHSNRYSNELCDQISSAFNMIVQGMVKAPMLADLRYTSLADLGFFDRVNKTEQPLAHDDIMDAFAEQLKAAPAHALTAFKDKHFSYAEGAALTNKIAETLKRVGVKPGDAVMVLPERSHWCVLGAYGVLAAGAAYVPVEEELPDERVAFMMADAHVRAVLASDNTLERVQALVAMLKKDQQAQQTQDIAIINLSDFERASIETATQLNLVPVAPSAPAVILYTSGTTGKPKGTLICRRAVLNLSECYAKRMNMTQDDVFGLYTAYSFDMHSLALFPVLIAGASSDVVPSEIRLDLDALDEHFRDSGTTMTCLTTHIGKMFASEGLGKSLRNLLVIGEKLGEFRGPDYLEMWESYGPTESIALVTTIPVNERSHSSSVGVLNSNVKSYILDAEGRRVPLGAAGELYLSGFQLASEYINRPEATAKAFVPNTLEIMPMYGHDRMYRTGDIARYLPDGTIGIIGRKDSQVKIRGNRIELDEVEAAVAAIPFVEQATVTTVEGKGGKSLIAYVVLDATNAERFEDDGALKQAVCDAVAENKPAYMVPSYVMRLDAIPQNANGKVDRRALPRPVVQLNAADYVAPTNALEEAVCTAFSTAMAIPRIGLDDDFHMLGGDSIQAIKVAHELTQAGYTCGAVAVLQGRTPRAIAKFLTQNTSDQSGALQAEQDGPSEHLEAVALEPLEVHEYNAQTGEYCCPLTDTQLNLYNNEVYIGKGTAYVFGDMYECPVGTTPEQALQAVHNLIRLHPVLSGKVAEVDGKICLINGGEPEIKQESTNPLSALGLRTRFMVPFNLAKAVSRFWVVSIGKKVIIAHACHHIISDAASIALVNKDLAALLAGTHTAELDLGFVTVCNNALAAKRKPIYQEAQQFFTHTLETIDIASIPLNASTQGHKKPGMLFVTLPTAAKELDQALAAKGLTRGMAFHATWAHTMAQVKGATTVVYKTGLHGRYSEELEHTLGCLAEFTLAVNDHCADLQDCTANIAPLMLTTIERSVYPYKLVKDVFPDITYAAFFEYVPLESAYRPGMTKKHTVLGQSVLVEHKDYRSDADVIEDFTGAVYDTKDGFVFTMEHSSKYSVEDMTSLGRLFFETLLKMVG